MTQPITAHPGCPAARRVMDAALHWAVFPDNAAG